MILIAGYAGLAAGVILLFLAHVAPRFGAGNFIREIDQPTAFGRKISHREAHLIGILIHLLVSLFAGLVFAWLVDQRLVSGFHFLPVLGWSVILTFVFGLIIMPLEGHGIFGVKHDAWFPVDLFLTSILWGLIFFALMRVWGV
ncbi:hypothetical protein EXS71_00295 [Candidatus Uhrbacteria bacterium]|nr:hypothetical protein [Candidatus Uhrbacteria bacterium]